MGGGLLLRGVAKAVTKPPILGLAAAAASSSSAPQSVSAMIHNPSSSSAAPGALLRASVAEDWVLAGDEERSEYLVRDHMVFGAAPSRDEVEEATTDLRNAFDLCVTSLKEPFPVPPSCQALQQDSPSSSIEGAPSFRSSVHADNPVVDWIEPHLVCHEAGNVQVRRRNEVAEAFQLLQNDPVVQGVVMSIASDKAVWEAVLSNEKVKEFRKKIMEEGVTGHVEDATIHDIEEKEKSAGDGSNLLDFLAQMLDYSKNAFLRLKLTLQELLNNLLSFADNKFFGSHADLADRAIKSCFMLSIIVLSVVMLKRASTA